MTSEQAKYFRDFKEITSRESFDADCEITVENFLSLVGEYHFPANAEEVSCQVRRLDKTAQCREGHRNGWLGRRKDGKEALIGINCGTQYFQASSAFVAQRRRITRELNIDRYIERLQATKGAPAFAAELERSIGRLRVVREMVSDFAERLPPSITNRLRAMAKATNAGVGVVFRYDDEDDKGEPKVEWVPEQIGVVGGIAVWEQSNLGTLFHALHEIRDTLPEVESSRAAGERKLKQWADTLDALAVCTSKVAALEAASESFSEPSNLKLLCFLVRDQNDAIVAARVAIEQEIHGPADSAAPRRLYKELSAEVGRRAGGRPFKIDA